MSKLLAVSSGVVPIETYEVQIKVKTEDVSQIEERLQQDEITVTRSSVRNQYDIYLCFDREELGRIRHREDEVINEDGSTQEIFYRITILGSPVERLSDNTILLTRSRYSVPADKSRRFYREYFKADQEIQVEKHRKRYHITYKKTRFAVNLDRLLNGRGETYLEIKSRTWSAKDAHQKAVLIKEMLALLGAESKSPIFEEYLHLV